VFDMDGLLIDSEPLWHRAEGRLLRDRGLDQPVLAKAQTVGMAPHETLQLYARLLGLDRSILPELWTDMRAIMRELYATEMVVLPGAAELVGSLRGRLPLGIASNTDLDLVQFALSVAGFGGAFEVVVSAGEVGRAKPAPDVYLEACRRLGVSPSEAVALEDSPTGVTAAKAAGLTVIAIPQFDGVDVAMADHVIDSLAALLPTSGGPAPG
jgi:HAD superfamily hydrolase (TIGR01509 family)